MFLRLTFDINHGENLIRVKLANIHHVVVEVRVEVEARNLELAVAEDLQDLVLTFESAKVLSSLVGIEAAYRVVKPDVASVERRDAFPTLLHFLDLVLREQVAPGIAALHGQLSEVVVDGLLLLVEQHQGHLDNLSLAIGIRREIAHLRTGFALREVVFLVTSDAFHGEAFHIMRCAILAVTIDDIVGRAVIVLVEHMHMDDLLSHKEFRLKLGYHVLTVFMEHDDVVHVGAVAHIFVGFLVLLAFQAFARADEAFVLVDVKLLVVGSHCHGGDIVEVTYLGLAFAAFAIFLFDVQKIIDGIVHDMVEVVACLFHALFKVGQLFVGLLDIES